MRVLVTGCAGFIGSQVTERLLDEGQQVVGVDSLNDAYDVRLKDWRLGQLQGKPGFTFQRGDIADREAMGGLFQSHGFDAVINLAARAGVRQSVENPDEYYRTNLNGTLALLDLCRDHEVKKFVLASTSSLYGSHNPRPFREDADTNRPLSPYAASKKAAETLCYTYHYLYGIDVTVLRYFTVYGPAGRPDMSVFRFIRWIAEGEPLVLYGDGSQERDFTYVGDIARGTVAALTPLRFQTINLGSDRPVPLREVIRMLEGMLEREAVVQRQPMPRTDVIATWADISRARELLGWKPVTSLEAGLRAAVDWYLKQADWARKVRLA